MYLRAQQSGGLHGGYATGFVHTPQLNVQAAATLSTVKYQLRPHSLSDWSTKWPMDSFISSVRGLVGLHGPSLG